MTNADGILPWQQNPWQQLTRRLNEAQFPHALLLHGPEGVGKVALANAMSQRLLCEMADGDAPGCGRCRSCKLLRAQSHEDFVELTLEEGRGSIGIDAVRDLIEFMNLTPRRSQRKVALIHPAERLTLNAANSLLKTLEEPPSAAVFLLVSARPAMLPPTVRSRCSKLQLGLPDEELALAWLSSRVASADAARSALRRARGAPLNALLEADAAWQEARASVLGQWLQVAESPALVFETAALWQKQHGGQAIRWVWGWLGDMVRCAFAGSVPVFCASEASGALQAMAKQVDLRRLFNHLSKVERTVRDLESGSLNAQLLIEDVLLEWSGLFGAGHRNLPRTGT